MNYEELKKLNAQYKSEMTAAERMAAYNRGEEVDFQPYTLQGPDPALANIYGYTTGEYARSFEVKCEIMRRRRDELGLDSFNVGLGLRTFGAAWGSKLTIPENGIDRISEHVLQEYKDFGKLEVLDPYTNKVLAPILENAKRLKDAFPDMTMSTNVVGPISNAIAVRPIEKFLRDTIKRPEEAKKLLSLTVESSLRWVEVFKKEFGVVGVSFNDPVTCMDVISKKQFYEFSLPYIKELMDGVEEIMGSKPGTHICGHTKPIWQDLADAGVSFFSVDNAEDLEEAKQMVGDKMRIAGNVPPIEVMMRGSIDDVIASCVDCMKKASDNPRGYLMNTGCQVPIGTPIENIEAYLYALKRYGRGAKMGCVPKGLEEVI